MYNYQSEFEAAAIQSYHDDAWTESDGSDEDKCSQNVGAKTVNNTHNEGGEIEL